MRVVALLALAVSTSTACKFKALERQDGEPDAQNDGRPAPPTLRGPISDSYTGAKLPADATTTFSWTPNGGDSRSLTYQLEIATDGAFTSGLRSFSTTAQSLQLNLAPYFANLTVPVGRKLFWRVTACYEGTCSAASSRRVLHYGRSSRDLNGDGYADLAIGEAFSGAGYVYVYFGGPQAFDTSVDGMLTLGQGGDLFGAAADIVGDVNGDGFADLLVGANGATPNGKAVIFFGGAGTSFNNVPDWTATGAANGSFGYAVSGAGDVNGDGYADVVVGAFNERRAYLYLGGSVPDTTADATLQNSTARYGISVAGGGDFDGDGLSDVAVGMIPDGAPGSVQLFYGAPAPTVLRAGPTLTKGTINDSFSRSLAFAGDLNGDGRSDLAVGAPSVEAAHVYLGQATPPIAGAPPTLTTANLGSPNSYGAAVSAAGDMNGDGFDDLLVSAPESSALGALSGHAFIFFGGTSFNPNPDVQINGEADYRVGAFARAVGDTNGDGFDDVVLCNEPGIKPLGRAYLYRGGTTILSAPATTFVGTVSNAGFGSAVARGESAPRLPHALPRCTAKST